MRQWTRLAGGTAAIAVAALLMLTSAGAATPGSDRGQPLGPPVDQLTSIPVPAVSAISAASHPPSSSEDQFVPITPCRIVDTRFAAAGSTTLSNNMVRDYYVAGVDDFGPQGGHAGGCGIPFDATAIAATFTAIDPSANGYLRAWPTGLDEPNATFLNYLAHANLGSGGVVSLRSAASGKLLRVKDYVAKTDLTIDVSGYYVPPIEALVSPAGTIFSGTSRVKSAKKIENEVGVFQVTVDSDVSYCTPMVTPYPDTNSYGIAASFHGTTVTVSLWRVGTNGAVAPYDGYFYLFVSC